MPSHQRRHDTDNNDRGNTTNNTINDGGDGDDTGEFSQPFWTRAKSKAGKALTTQNARNNSNKRNNKQRLHLSDHDIHNTPSRDSRRRSYSDVTRSTMTCQFCAEPGHSTRECGFGDYAKCRQCGQDGHKQTFCHAYTCKDTCQVCVGNVTPDVSRKTNVANTNDVCDVSAQHSIRTFSGLRNLFTRHNGF